MRNQTLPKTVSLALAAIMMTLTLSGIDQLATTGSPAVQMAANAKFAKFATHATHATPAPKTGTAAPRS